MSGRRCRCGHFNLSVKQNIVDGQDVLMHVRWILPLTCEKCGRNLTGVPHEHKPEMPEHPHGNGQQILDPRMFT